MYGAIYDVMNLISHVCQTRKFVMAISHGKQGLLCDKYKKKLCPTTTEGIQQRQQQQQQQHMLMAPKTLQVIDF